MRDARHDRAPTDAEASASARQESADRSVAD
jgi:hypothetical protein